jgi:hypothetical protein
MSSVDILNIDFSIKREFLLETAKIPYYKNRLKELLETLKYINKGRSYSNIKDNIKELENKIEKIVSEYQLSFYIIETVQLVERYKKILSTPVKISFTGKIINDNKEKNDIIDEYLAVSYKYNKILVNSTVEKSKIPKVSCNNCENKKQFDIVDNSIYICILCGSQQEILLHTSSYKDIDRINISSKYTYDRKVHFRDCINQYQGKQNSTIDQNVYKSLMDQFKKHHLLVDKEKTKKGKCKNITKEHIHLFLKELKYTKHYENVNLIHYTMSGIKPDDISHLEDKLLDDFDLLTELYDKKFRNKPEFKRKNFINTQYVLYQLLIKYNHPCKKEDFTILKTSDRKSFHDDVAKICFEDLNWNHTPLF